MMIDNDLTETTDKESIRAQFKLKKINKNKMNS